MVATIQKYLSVLDSNASDWEARVISETGLGRNCLVIVSKGKEADLKNVFGLSELPKPLDQAGVISLSLSLLSTDLSALLDALDHGRRIYFIERLDLPATQPPKVREYLVYCSLRGIIGDFDSPEQALITCTQYRHMLSRLREPPQAGVYRWRGRDWHYMEWA